MQIFQREMDRKITVITLKIQALDAANVQQVTASLAEALRGEGCAVVDLGALRYCDVSGFAAILKWVASSSGGQQVRLCSRSGTIQALFELLRAESVVPLYQSRDEAMASFRGLAVPGREEADAHTSQERGPVPSRRIA